MDNEIKNNSEEQKKENSKFFYAISLGLELGFMIAIPLILFVLGGLYVDRIFNTTPLFLILGLLLNVIFTIFEVKKIILPFLEKRSRNNKNIQ